MALVRSRKRPHSRGSTASIHSASTQPNIDHAYGEPVDGYQQAHWVSNMRHGLSTISHQHHHSQPRELAPAPQLTPEDLLVASQYSMDGSVHASMHGAPFPQSHHMNRQSMSHDSFAGNNSFADDSQLLDRDGLDDGDSFAGMPGGTKSGSRSSANNETEMRQLFNTNKHRHLQDVAEELHGNERGPNSERTRQIFAMLWINQVCSTGKGSVPRGRVYANYASRCAAERITVLNPASFGKLVRVLFPGLKTRRLGVRGESKYHYVNFSLTEEHPGVSEQSVPPLMPLGETASFSATFQSAPSASSALRPVHPAYVDHLDTIQPPVQQQRTRPHGYEHSLYNQPLVANVDQLQSTTSKTILNLYFAPELDGGFEASEPLVLPAIGSFLPSGTDTDAAISLAALYRSHCTSLVECIRYCKEKTFFHLFTSFQGTLTMPVQKLFGNPAIAAWIEECDFVLYQRMIRIISKLTLQVVPKPVLDTLRSISERLVAHIRESFQGQPQYVVRAKEAPATIFAALLDRVLRVNLTAHAAANMLANPANRDLMYTEWIQVINVRKLAQSIPTRGMDDLVNLLLAEMRDLLDPVDVPWEVECMTLQGDVVSRNGRRTGTGNPADNLTTNVLDRWVGFLRSLPEHFPYASHTDIVWCVEKVGAAVMRELTITQGKSFGSWWVTKCWIDEMIMFLAELGGFMQQKISQSVTPPKQGVPDRNSSTRTSHFSNASEDAGSAHVSQSQPDRAQFPAERVTNETNHSSANSAHDDSGIGIRTPDEDVRMEKFGFTPVNGQDSFDAADLQHHMAQI